MLSSFFVLAAVSPSRQRTFRALVACHVIALAGCLFYQGANQPLIIGQMLLVAGIIEGSLLVGWRLTQMPKSLALEFLFVSPLRPGQVLLAEALVGLARLICVTLAGLPLLLFMAQSGILWPGDVPWLLLVPGVWGAVAGLGLTAWAYESLPVRRWGERVLMASIVLYLVVGVLAGENLRQWLNWLPDDLIIGIIGAIRWFHEANPFGVMKFAMENPPDLAWPRQFDVTLLGLAGASVLLGRCAWRLKGHFHDRHYLPVLLTKKHQRTGPGDQPLAWWAVKRVTEYSGRINLWLAGGFGTLYAVYVVAGTHWPSWLGRQAFAMFDSMGGIPVLATALVLLGAVPAAFQYGLWDSNAQDRCRRLELLLLTRLDGLAYWDAASAAAWKRGRGYLGIAVLLWSAGLLAGQTTPVQMATSVTAGVLLWGLYFALGFWAFTRGHQANMLGLGLTLGLPLTAFVLFQVHCPQLAVLIPAGGVYQAARAAPSWSVLGGSFLAGVMALAIGRRSLAHCDEQLRRWYDRHSPA